TLTRKSVEKTEQGRSLSWELSSRTRFVTIRTWRGLAPPIANISPLRYSLLRSALRSRSRCSSAVNELFGCEAISTLRHQCSQQRCHSMVLVNREYPPL